MRDYLRSVWAMLTPCKEDTVPLLASNCDLEACGGASDADSIVVVCDAPLPVCSHSHPHFERVSPFSEYHFPVRPFVFASDA